MRVIKSIVSMVKNNFFGRNVFCNYQESSTKSNDKTTSDEGVFFDQNEHTIEEKPKKNKKLQKAITSVFKTLIGDFFPKKVFVDPEIKIYKPTDVIKIKHLSHVEVQEIRSTASKKFKKLDKVPLVKKIFGFNRKMKLEHRDINPQVFTIMEYIKPLVKDKKYIFRLDEKSKDVLKSIEALRSFEKIEYENIDVTILCTILKQYTTKYLNGIFSFDLASSLSRAAKRGTKGNLTELISLIPFILSNTEILFLKKLFELFKLIDENSKVTFMSIDSLLSLFSLVLFPEGVFVKLEDLLISKKIMFGIYELDFDTVPPCLIQCLM